MPPSTKHSVSVGLEQALLRLPPLPSLIRYWDDFAEVWRTIPEPSSNTWPIKADGEIYKLKFSSLSPQLPKDLIKHWLWWSLGKHACATVRTTYEVFVRVSDRACEIMFLKPMALREHWYTKIKPSCSNFQLRALKSLLQYCCEYSIGALQPGLCDFVSALRLHPSDPHAAVRAGDVFLSVQEDAAIVAYLDEVNHKLQAKVLMGTEALIRACALALCYQHAMRPYQIAKVRLSEVSVYHFDSGPAVHIVFYRGKQRIDNRRYAMRRQIKREWCWIFAELHRRRISGEYTALSKNALADSYFGLTPPEISRMVRNAADQACGAARTATDFRHTAAQRLVDAGASELELAEFMGHTSLQSGLVYFEGSVAQAARVNQALAISPVYRTLGEVALTRRIDMAALLALDPEHQVGAVPHGIPIAGIGACDIGQSLCAKNPVLSCYSCDKFMAVTDLKVHQEVLQSLRPVVKQFIATSYAESFTPAYLQLRSVLEALQRIISELAGENGDRDEPEL